MDKCHNGTEKLSHFHHSIYTISLSPLNLHYLTFPTQFALSHFHHSIYTISLSPLNSNQKIPCDNADHNSFMTLLGRI